MHRFEGKSAVIVGGATGIGAATARRLGAEGAHVVVGDLDLEKARATAGDIVDSGGTAVAVGFDLADEPSIAALMREAVSTYGGIDLLYNSGADLRADTFRDDTDAVRIDVEHWNHILRVNLTGYMLACRYAIPSMLERGGGAIVCTTSDIAFFVHPRGEQLSYSTSKLGVVALVRHVAARWAAQGIRCNCISPGSVSTESWRQLQQRPDGADTVDSAAKRNPRGRVCTPDEVAGAVTFLLSHDAAGVNAQVLHVNGGAVLNW
jgi:NAD(P)-dependent dehydrogenase (short-subunit alcohol dehydrogenase family)